MKSVERLSRLCRRCQHFLNILHMELLAEWHVFVLFIQLVPGHHLVCTGLWRRPLLVIHHQQQITVSMTAEHIKGEVTHPCTRYTANKRSANFISYWLYVIMMPCMKHAGNQWALKTRVTLNTRAHRSTPELIYYKMWKKHTQYVQKQIQRYRQ